MFQHFSENTGANLGDDMGLGKTVQVMNFIFKFKKLLFETF